VREVREPAPPGAARVARLANIILFSLNLAWITTWYVVCHTTFGLSDVDTVFHWHFWMPEPGWVARQVVYSFVLCIPFSLVFFLLAHVSGVGRFLRAVTGPFAIAAGWRRASAALRFRVDQARRSMVKTDASFR